MPQAARSPIAQALLATMMCGASFAAFAQAPPDTDNGRFKLSALPDGSYLRLDTRSGAVSTCANASSGWECRASPDERAALDAEIGRLQAENDSLRDRLAQADAGKNAEAMPKSDPLAPTLPRSADGERKLEIPLPSDRDLDRVMGAIEKAWRRLVEMASRLQRDSSGKI